MLDKALRSLNAKEWMEALQYKIRQLEELRTWEVVNLPPSQSAIPCSEVIRVKCGPDGEVQSYRVRIVAGGHRQVEGINYNKTFSAAAKMPTVWVVLGNAAQQDWEIEHVDIKSAYLNVPLKKEIYMRAPRGILKPGQEGKVLRLLKGLYGLKQAGRGWYLEMLNIFIKKLRFKQSAIDHSVFYQRMAEEHTIVAVVTADMAVTWDITNHGPIKWFLGFEIRRNQEARTLSINQQAYIEAMVNKFGLTNMKRVSIPLDPHVQYSVKQCPSSLTQVARMKEVPYSKAIGSILWPTVISHPDTAYAIGILSQFMQNPGPVHWEAAKWVISYLGSTKDLWLTFGGKGGQQLEGYCNADWGS